jgi:hypothetical protein
MADTKPIIPIKSSAIYYIQPSANVPNILAIVIIIAGFAFLIFKVTYTLITWEASKCKGANFMLSPFLGSNSADTFNKCVQSAYNSVSSDTESVTYKKIVDLEKNVAGLTTIGVGLKKKSADITGTPLTSAANDQLTGTITNIQSAISKILGSVVLSSYLTNGVLQSSNTLENGDLTKLLKQYNNAGKNINSQAMSANAVAAMV